MTQGVFSSQCRLFPLNHKFKENRMTVWTPSVLSGTQHSVLCELDLKKHISHFIDLRKSRIPHHSILLSKRTGFKPMSSF